MLRKFFTTVAVGSLFVGGLAATHVAFAQDGGPGPRGMRGGPMMMADANKDGTITKAELTASLEARFAKLDANKDGKVTAEEMKAARQAMRGPGRGHDRGPGRGPGADQAPPPPPAN